MDRFFSRSLSGLNDDKIVINNMLNCDSAQAEIDQIR